MASKTKEEIIAGMSRRQKEVLHGYENFPHLKRSRISQGLPVWDDVKDNLDVDTRNPGPVPTSEEEPKEEEKSTFDL